MAKDIVMRMSLKAQAFNDALKQSGDKLSKFGRDGQRGVSDLGTMFTRLGGILTTVFATGAFARAITNVARLGDELAKMSAKTGFSVETLNGLTQAAKLADVSQEQLSIGLFQLNKNLLDTTRNTGEAKVSFAAMGIGAKEAGELLKTPLQAFLTMADRLVAIRDPSVRAAEAMRIFGKSGAQLLPLLNEGRDAIAAQIKELQALRPITTEQAKAAEAFNDSMTKLTSAFEGLTQKGLGPLLPKLTDMVELMTRVVALDTGGFADRLSQFTGTITGNIRGLGGTFIILNAELEKLLRFKTALGQIESLGDAFGGTERGRAIDRALQRDVERIVERRDELLGKIFPSATGGKPFSSPDVAPSPSAVAAIPALVAATKQTASKFQLKLDRFSAADPQKALQEILDGFGLEEELLGAEITDRLRHAFQRVNFGPGSLAARESQSLFELRLDPNNETKAIQAIRDQINAKRELLELEGKRLEGNRELLLLEQDLANALGAREERLGRSIVAQGSADFARQQATALAPFLDAQRRAEQALAIGDLRVDDRGQAAQLPGTRLLRQIDVLEAQRGLAEERFRQTGEVEYLDIIDRLDEGIRAFKITLDTLDFKTLEARFQSVGNVVSGTINTMVQGLLLGTQNMADIWRNLLRNLAAQSINKGIEQIISLGATSLAASLTLAQGGVVGGGGLVPLQRFSMGGIATRPTLAMFGEGSTNEAFVPLPDGRRIPVVMQGGGGGRPVVNIYNSTGQPAETKESRAPDGSFQIDAFIGGAAAKDVARRGPFAQAMESVYGLKRSGGVR